MTSGEFQRNAERAGRLLDEGLSHSKIAARLGVSMNAVYQYLRATGRSEKQSDRRRFSVDDLRLAISRGFKTASTAAEVIGCSPGTVRMLAKEYKITLEADNTKGDDRRERLTAAARLFMGEASIEEIGVALDVKVATVRGYLIHVGLMETKQQVLERKYQKVPRLLETTDLTKVEIAKGMGLHPSQLSRLLRRGRRRLRTPG